VNFWQIFGKNAPNAKKYRPNGKFSPNLVTLDYTINTAADP
jgi:hypothetical protein